MPDKPPAEMDLGEEGNDALDADEVADAPDDDDDGRSSEAGSEASQDDDLGDGDDEPLVSAPASDANK